MVPDTSVPASGEMSLPGDSGSAWLELTTNRPVGLHFAGEGAGDPQERSSAKHMLHVLDTLGVMVFTGSAIGRAFIGSHCRVLARTRARARCFLSVAYPSGGGALPRASAPRLPMPAAGWSGAGVSAPTPSAKALARVRRSVYRCPPRSRSMGRRSGSLGIID